MQTDSGAPFSINCAFERIKDPLIRRNFPRTRDLPFCHFSAPGCIPESILQNRLRKSAFVPDIEYGSERIRSGDIRDRLAFVGFDVGEVEFNYRRNRRAFSKRTRDGDIELRRIGIG